MFFSPALMGTLPPPVTRGDRILEVNNTDVTNSRLDEVSTLVQLTPHVLEMVVVPKVITTGPSREEEGSWAQALRALENDLNADAPAGGLDPTQPPPNNLRAAILSIFCCPIIGLAATYHSLQVETAWRNGNFYLSRGHATLSRKLASQSIFYGIMIAMLYFFVQVGDEQQDKHPGSNGWGHHQTSAPTPEPVSP